MNTSLFSHQFRFELRRQPWVTAVYVAAGVLLPLGSLLAGSRLGREAAQASHLAALGVMATAAAILLERGLTATPFSGSTGFWMTRPIPRATVFWSKSLWLGVAIVLPPALGWALRATALRLTPLQAASGAAFVAALILVIVLAIAVVMALGRSRSETLALAVGFAAAAAGSLLVLVVPTQAAASRGVLIEPMLRSRGVVVLAALLAAFAAAWVLAALLRRRGPALGLLYAGALPALLLAALWRHDFMRGPGVPPIDVQVALASRSVAELQPPNDRGPRQVLWSTLAIDGLGDREIVVPASIQASIAAAGMPAVDLAPFPPLTISRIDEAAALRVIASDFPETTSWSGGAGRPKAVLASTSGIGIRQGKIEGTLDGTVIRIHREAELPLDIGARAGIDGGGSVAITERVIDGNAMRVVARFDVPAVGGAKLFDAGRLQGSPPVWAVLFHPEDGLAAFRASDGSYYQNYESATPIRAFSNGFTFVLPALRIGLLGSTVEEWLAGARLIVYSGRPTGRFTRTFAAAGFSLPDGTDESAASSGLPVFPGEESLETGATPAAISDHIDRLIYGTRDATGYVAFENALMALPADALAVLADRVPCHEMADSAILRVLARRLPETPADALVRGVSRSLRFIPLCRARGLEHEIAPIVRERIARRVPLPFGTIGPAIAFFEGTDASPVEPVLASDLRWHFDRAGAEQGEAADVLEEVAGFDFASALRDAWARSRLMGDEASATGLAPFALRLGDFEALRLSLAHRPNLPVSSAARQRLDTRLDAALAAPAASPATPLEDKIRLAHARFHGIAWEAESGTFRIPQSEQAAARELPGRERPDGALGRSLALSR